MTKKIVAIFIFLVGARCSFAWGPRGHQLVARIAERRLSHRARGEIRALLGNDDLVSVSTWADEIRPERPETARWHFVDIPLESGGFSDQRDCPISRGQRQDQVGNCVVDRIKSFAKQLADPSMPVQSRAEALKFLVHLVADIHQPMHTVADADAGNHIYITEFGTTQCGDRPCNLHLLWDTGLLQHSHRSERKLAGEIEALIVRERLQAKPGETPESWANESFHLAQNVWLQNGATVDDAYYRQNIHVAEARLALAGIRLAALLNQAFAGSHANQRYSMK
jgi:hypothetical protein